MGYGLGVYANRVIGFSKLRVLGFERSIYGS